MQSLEVKIQILFQKHIMKQQAQTLTIPYAHIQERMRKMSEQSRLKSSLCAHNITIDNKTDQDLNLTIRYEDEPYSNNLQVPKKILVPKGTSRNHLIYDSNQNIHSHQQLNRSIQKTPQNRTYLYEPFRQVVSQAVSQVQRKFQPMNHHLSRSTRVPLVMQAPYDGKNHYIRVSPQTTQIRYHNLSPPHQKNEQNTINQLSRQKERSVHSSQSSVKQQFHHGMTVQSKVVAAEPTFIPVRFTYGQPFTPEQSKVRKEQQTAASQTQHYEPYHTQKLQNSALQNEAYQQHNKMSAQRLSYSPQVYNYISQLYQKSLPDQDSSFHYTFSQIKQSQPKKRNYNDWKIQPLEPIRLTFKPLEPQVSAIQSRRKIFTKQQQNATQKSSKSKQKQPTQRKQRQLATQRNRKQKKDLNNTQRGGNNQRLYTQPLNRHSVQKFYYHHLPDQTYYQIANKKNKQREDLFVQRKRTYLTQLQDRLTRTQRLQRQMRQNKKSNKSKDSKAGRSAAQILIKAAQIVKTTAKKDNKMNSTAQAVTERLYRSKTKHYSDRYKNTHDKSDRQRFQQMLRGNSFVSRYISNSEAEYLFQKFKQEKDSVSYWPMKIVNYTYEKLKQGNRSRSKDCISECLI